MGYTASELLDIARAEIGYKEKESNSQLDNPSANAGDANYTKYARDLAAAGYYQASKQGFEWCDMFIDWCFLQLCGSKEKAEDMICQTGLYGAGCEWSARYFQEQGRFYENDPKPGDQIFFNDFNHTGIVEKIEGNVITTIEGNTDNMVARRTYIVGSGSIDGYGRPKYAVEKPVETVETPEAADIDEKLEIGDIVIFTGSRHYISANARIWFICSPGRAKITQFVEGAKHPFHLVKVDGGGSTVYGWVDKSDLAAIKAEKPESGNITLPTLKNGSEGEQVRALQILLMGNGCSMGGYGADGIFGAITESAVSYYQRKHGITASGICDRATWAKLLGI